MDEEEPSWFGHKLCNISIGICPKCKSTSLEVSVIKEKIKCLDCGYESQDEEEWLE